MNEIKQYGVVAGAVCTNGIFNHIGNGLAMSETCNTGTINHAVNIVGWGETIANGRVYKYWIIQNSWGKNWGAGGFGYMERESNGLGGCLSQVLMISPRGCKTVETQPSVQEEYVMPSWWGRW